MGTLVYILCAATSTLCAFMLLKSFVQTKTRLLLWSGICFSLLALANAVLYVDLLVIPQVDLSPLRNFLTAVGSIILLFGLIWETV